MEAKFTAGSADMSLFFGNTNQDDTTDASDIASLDTLLISVSLVYFWADIFVPESSLVTPVDSTVVLAASLSLSLVFVADGFFKLSSSWVGSVDSTVVLASSSLLPVNFGTTASNSLARCVILRPIVTCILVGIMVGARRHVFWRYW